MRIKKVLYGKELKLGLPNYSNITVTMHMEVELAEGEKQKDDSIWDHINHQLFRQTDLDPSWLTTQTGKDWTKYILKIPNNNEK